MLYGFFINFFDFVKSRKPLVVQIGTNIKESAEGFFFVHLKRGLGHGRAFIGFHHTQHKTAT